VIVCLLLTAALLHFGHQACRIAYPSFSQSEDGGDGQLPLLLTFFPSIGCSLAAAAVQGVELAKLQRADPTRYPPSALEQAVRVTLQRVRHGGEAQWAHAQTEHPPSPSLPVGVRAATRHAASVAIEE
jgi:hypothetical protein